MKFLYTVKGNKKKKPKHLRYFLKNVAYILSLENAGPCKKLLRLVPQTILYKANKNF